MIAAELGPGAPVLAVDVGGTSIRVAIVDDTGRFSTVTRAATPVYGADPGQAVADEVTRLAQQASRVSGRQAAVAGVVVPGVFDDVTGEAVYSENIGWHNVFFSVLLGERLGMPVAAGHDVRSAALAEVSLAGLERVGCVVVMLIGTGISAAIFIDGVLYSGGGFAGEIGHTVVDPGGAPCACGGRGCLEAIASTASIARRYQALVGERGVDAEEVVRRARGGEDAAGAVWGEAISALAAALAQLQTIVAPDVVVLGGGLAEADGALLHPLAEELNRRLTIQKRPELRKASLGHDAGIVGAALLARGHRR